MTKHTDTVCQRLMNGYARNSCDRFGDDLCQELLQYLPFRDKVRLECVSRQWERSVYAKQQTLHIEDAMKLTFDGLPVTKLLLYYSSDATKLLPQLNGVSVIERLLAKCAHIRHIVIRSTFSCANKTITYDRLLRAIADHCGGLVSFEYCEDEYNRISENAWRYLGEKSSKTMRNYVCGTDPFWRFVDSHYTFLKLCNNLKTIDNIKLKELINGEIIAPKLSEVKLTNGSDDTELMDAFVGRYKNTIKLFESGYSGSDLNHFMKQLSQLCLLENLSLFMSGVDISQFGVNFKSIAVNCSQLKYLSLDLDDTMASDISYAQLFNSINCCSQLKYLHLFLFEEFTNNNSEDSNKLSLQSLKGCSRLTHLNITIDIIDDKFFAGIEQCFPQLKVIDIQSNKPLTDKTMHRN